MLPKVIIPSYKRINTLKIKTLQMLESYQYPKELIYIFTAPEEYELYFEAFPTYNVIRGLKGLMEQRNFVTDYFDEGERLVCIDDDVESVFGLVPIKDSVIPKFGLDRLPDFQDFVRTAFQETDVSGLSLWGIYPIENEFFMKPTITHDLKFCIGHLYGIINRKDIKLTLCYKEDYERTLRFFERDKGVLRYNFVCAKTKMYQPGGIDQNKKERLQENIKSSNTLINLFPGLVKMNTRKEGEILLRPIKSPLTQENDTKARTKSRANKITRRTKSSIETLQNTCDDNEA